MVDQAGGYEVAVAGSRYGVRTTLVTPNGQPVQRVVVADPRRCYFEVYSSIGGTTVGQLLPVSNPPGGFTFAAVGAPIVQKWKDAPALCTGDWYGAGTDAAGWLLIECFLLG